MRRRAIGFFILLVMSFLLIIDIDIAHAAEHKLENLHIQVIIEDNGDAKIIETRQMTLSEGTENYIVIGNLGKSKIKDFKVTENGQEYEFLKKWDLNKSREEKAFKNGIIKTSDGYELSWGIGEYGYHEYVVEFVVTDFIKQLKDAQVLFWRFVNDEQNVPPENVTVEIEASKNLNEDEERIWAFGFTGDVYFSNGKVIAQSTKPLTAANYVTLFVQFEDGLFATKDKINRSFEDVQDEAFVGSDYGKEGPASGGIKGFFATAFDWAKKAIQLVFWLIVIILFGIAYVFYKKGPQGMTRKKFTRKYKEQYYREYPYKGDHLDAYYIMYHMGIGSFENLFTSLLLKWIKEGRIAMDIEEGGFLRKQRSTLTILKAGMDESSEEGKLFRMLEMGAGKKKMMDENHLKRWAESRHDELERWERQVLKASAGKLTDQDYLTAEQKKLLFFKRTIYNQTAKGMEVEENTYKFVNYLHDYSLLNEHEAINVHIWDEMMIWAGYLGLTAVVMKQFEALYPKYVEESVYRHSTVDSTRRMVSRTSEGRKTAEQKRRDSGGGGAASTGGGGGSFGGGSGGGTR